jgi:hypothetical protein
MRLLRTTFPTSLLIVFTLLAAAPAFAQEKGDNGVTMGYPLSVGFVTHVSDRVALRPELQLSFASADTNTGFDFVGTTSNLVGAGISALIYIGEPDKLRTYVSPRYVFTRSEITIESPFGTRSENINNSHSLIVSFGAQYALHERFSVFGEVGVASTFDRRKSGQTPIRAETTTVSTRTGAGIVFYF